MVEPTYMLAALPPLIHDNLEWVIALALVLVGVVIYGFHDLARLNIGRVWAISSVCFAESFRRKVWLIAPLAIVGVIIVTQFQRAIDEQDAIRQTIKFSLFASGLVVTVTAIILACTNLPREIDSRVIFTIVTKPTTRLEIVLGKIIGFARVSALILLVMGLFTFGYLHWRAWWLGRDITQRLASDSVEASLRPTYEHYSKTGLLTSRTLSGSDSMQIYSRLPDPQTGRRFMRGGGDGDMLFPFSFTRESLIPPGDPEMVPAHGGVVISLQIGYEWDKDAPPEQELAPGRLPPTVAAPTTGPAVDGIRTATCLVTILDRNQNTIIATQQINDNRPVELADPSGVKRTDVFIPFEAAAVLEKNTDIFVAVIAGSSHAQFFPGKDPCRIIIPAAPGNRPRLIEPMPDSSDPSRPGMVFRGRQGNYGQQIRGGGKTVAVFDYKGTPITAPADGQVTIEFKAGIEKSSIDEESDEYALTRASIEVRNLDTGATSQPVVQVIESNRPAFFQVPAEFLQSGNFNLHVRSLTPGHYLSFNPDTVRVVRSNDSFTLNLIKSMFILWLMAVLVTAIAIFTSTFVSWPIAIVLTVVLLLGRWGVEQLGDATQPGIGNLVAQDLFKGSDDQDPAKMRAVSASVEALSRLLNVVSAGLPDLTRFPATEDIERGATVPLSKVIDATKVVACYGLSAMALAYVFLRNKEVAP